MSLKNILKNGMGFENIINKEANKLKDNISKLKQRKLSPKQQKKLEMIEAVFSSLSSKEVLSKEGREKITKEIETLKTK